MKRIHKGLEDDLIDTLAKFVSREANMDMDDAIVFAKTQILAMKETLEIKR